ncbi:response regulator [Agreia sp. PsM10]|uniref:response regulator n=1 Tax=Agreia sp. PsM10 TaxID=3030533 RepID=UPI00263B0C6D|nr:response regulator [Agreia sp. PsM10]MDN4640767.1 response regulator [Agreia sp. PsM10]
MSAVVVVDDDRDAAEDYARLVTQATGLSAVAYDDPGEAEEAVRSGGVAIVVLDQQMPQILGIDLFIRLREIDPRVRGVLLTGEASSSDVGEALNRGFSRYIAKPQALTQLPGVIRGEYIQYQNHALIGVSAEQPVIARRRKWWPIGSLTTIRLIALEIVNESLVRDEDWREVLTLQAGQKRRATLSRTAAWTLQLEDEVSTKIGAEFSLGVGKVSKLSAKLQNEVSVQLRESMTSSVTEVTESEESFELPPEPQDVNTVHVRARRVQQAPVLISARLVLSEDCNCCSRPHVLTVQVLVDTGTLALRHVDLLSNGEDRTIPLGRSGAA